MARYIDADELLGRLPDNLPYKASVKRVLLQAPTADVVEVVRCRDCEYREMLYDRVMCRKSAHRSEDGVWFGLRATGDHHFCSYGERKEQE